MSIMFDCWSSGSNSVRLDARHAARAGVAVADALLAFGGRRQTYMDLISQIQQYVRTMAASMAHSVEHLHSQSPSVSADYHHFDSEALVERAQNLFKLIADSRFASCIPSFSCF